MQIKKLYRYLYIPTLITMLASCAADVDEPKDLGTNIAFGFAAKDVLDWEPIVTTRAAEPLETRKPLTIGVFGYNNALGQRTDGCGEIFPNTVMYNKLTNPDAAQIEWAESNDWPYDEPIQWLNRQAFYKFYAYAPYFPSTADDPATDIYVTGQERTFNSFSRVTFHNVPYICGIDFLTAHHIRSYTSNEKANQNIVQKMFMQHLQSRLRFCFKIGQEFSELREIHITGIEVVNSKQQSYTVTIDFSENTTTETYGGETYTGFPIDRGGAYWTPNASGNVPEMEPLELESEDGEIILNIDNRDVFTPAGSAYVYPYADVANLTIRVTYDVYDIEKKQLLRKGDTTTGTLKLDLKQYKASSPNEVKMLAPGRYYDVNITVEPKFLYALSDNDFDADGFIVINPDAPQP